VRLYQTPPTGTTTWEFIAKATVTLSGLGDAGGEYCGVFLYLGNSVNDQFCGVNVYANDASAASYVYRRVESCDDNGAGAYAVMTTNISHAVSPGQWVYLKLKKTTANAYTSANTYEAWVSTNGIVWEQVGTVSKTFTTACNEIGLLFRRPKSQANTPKGYGLVDFFRKTA
jgi:hypothetical protein